MGYTLPPVAAITTLYIAEAGKFSYLHVYLEGYNKPMSKSESVKMIVIQLNEMIENIDNTYEYHKSRRCYPII